MKTIEKYKSPIIDLLFFIMDMVGYYFLKIPAFLFLAGFSVFSMLDSISRIKQRDLFDRVMQLTKGIVEGQAKTIIQLKQLIDDLANGRATLEIKKPVTSSKVN